MTNARRKQRPAPLSWCLIEGHWHLRAGKLTVAVIAGAPGGYVTNIPRRDGYGSDCIDCGSLAQAKAILLRWWSQRTTFRLAARYYGIGGPD